MIRSEAPVLTPRGPLDADDRPIAVGDEVTIDGRPALMPADPHWHGKSGRVTNVSPRGWVAIHVDGHDPAARRVFHPRALTRRARR